MTPDSQVKNPTLKTFLFFSVFFIMFMAAFTVGILLESVTFAYLSCLIVFILLFHSDVRLHLVGILFMLILYNEFPDNAEKRIGLFYSNAARIIDIYLLLWLFRSFFYPQETNFRRQTSLYFPVTIAAMIWGLFQIFNGVFNGSSFLFAFSEARPFIFGILFFYALVQTIKTKEMLRFLFTAALLLTGIRSFAGLARHFLGTGSNQAGIFGFDMLFIGHDSKYFTFFLIYIFLSLLLLPLRDMKHKGVLFFTPTVLFSLLYSFRRGDILAWILSSATAFVFILFSKSIKKNARSTRIIFLLLCIALLLVSSGSLFGNVRSHMMTVSFTGEHMKKDESNPSEISNLTRLWEIGNGFYELKDHWLLGLGFGARWDIHIPYMWGEPPTRTRFHNTYMCIWVKYGIIGLIIYLSYFISTFKTGLKVLRNEQYALEDKLYTLFALTYILFFMISSNVGDLPYYIRAISPLSLCLFIVEFYSRNNYIPITDTGISSGDSSYLET